MKIETVKLMRDLRSQISSDTEGMNWDEKRKYLDDNLKTFRFLTENRSEKKARHVVQAR